MIRRKAARSLLAGVLSLTVASVAVIGSRTAHAEIDLTTAEATR